MISTMAYEKLLVKIENINSDPKKDDGLKVYEIQIIIEKFHKDHIENINPTIKQIVADAYHLSSNSLGNTTRATTIKNARQVAMWFYYHYTTLNLKAIGIEFSDGKHNFSHCTVLYTIHKIDELLTVDKILMKEVASITETVEKYYQRAYKLIKSVTI